MEDDSSIRTSVELARTVFERLMADGPGQEQDQATQAKDVEAAEGWNYYVDDPVESYNFRAFVKLVGDVAAETGNRRVLVAACGDGLESELLARAGFDVTAFDLAASGAEQTRLRLERQGLFVRTLTDDLTHLQLHQYPDAFAGVMFAQAACFLPHTPGEWLLAKAVTDLASLADIEAAFYYSTTMYPPDPYPRVWRDGDTELGTTLLYRHPAVDVAAVLQASGWRPCHRDAYMSGPGPNDYANEYLLARRTAH